MYHEIEFRLQGIAEAEGSEVTVCLCRDCAVWRLGLNVEHRR
jgi:hypothetical protein